MTTAPDPTPAISVLMPAMNAQATIGQAIGSILDQTLSDWQLLVIDDGSTDATATIVAEIAKGDRRIRLVKQSNQGITRTLNQGLQLIASPLVARMDSDDIALPDRLRRQLDFLQSHPSVVAVGGQARLMQGDRLTDRYWRYPCDPASIRQALPHKSVLIHPAVMFRRQAILAMGGYRSNLPHSQDYDLWLRLSEKHDLANLPEVVIHYRQHTGSITASKGLTQTLCAMACRWSAMQRAKGKPDPLDDPNVTIDPATLQRWGMEPTIMDRAIIDSLADAIALAINHGQPEVARQRLNELAEHPWAKRTARLAMAHRYWLTGRLDWSRGRKTVGLWQMICAAGLKPKYAERLIRAAKNGHF